MEKVAERKATAAVVGLGYVGLPLAIEIAKAGFMTTGLDLSATRVDALQRGESYIRDVDSHDLSDVLSRGVLQASTDFSVLSTCDFISICVPTPLGKGKNPDLSFIVDAVTTVKQHLRVGHVILLESTTYPGTTEEVVLPLLLESGLKVGEEFHLAFSPERIDPGNRMFHLKNTPKVVGGVTKNCTEIAHGFYLTFVEKVIPVSSPRAAEMVKLLENTFRAVNIGLANEVAIMCNHLEIDTWEVIDAAATKPFGFLPFYPGPGLGGHCIPVDPHYLVWKLKSIDYNPRFIQLADEVNSAMPLLVVEKIAGALNACEKPVKGASILIMGVAYKSDVDDVRESPALNVIRLLQERHARVAYHDPFIPTIDVEGRVLKSVASDESLQKYDCVVILTHHSVFDVAKIVDEAILVVDTRNATKGIRGRAEKIIKI